MESKYNISAILIFFNESSRNSYYFLEIGNTYMSSRNCVCILIAGMHRNNGFLATWTLLDKKFKLF